MGVAVNVFYEFGTPCTAFEVVVNRSVDRPKTCFIVGREGVLFDRLRRRLQAEQITCFSWHCSTASRFPAVSVRAMMQRADFVAGVLQQKPCSNVIFELGLAVGSRKPLLFFAEESATIPGELSFANILAFDALDDDNWDSYLHAFLQTVEPLRSVKPRGRPKLSLIAAERGAGVKAQSRSKFDEDATLGMERAVECAFAEEGYALIRPPQRQQGADFLLASQGLMESFGLPVLIKLANDGKASLDQEMVDSMAALIADRRGGAGLILVPRRPANLDCLAMDLPLAIVTLDEVLEWLNRGTFEESFHFIVDSFWTRAYA